MNLEDYEIVELITLCRDAIHAPGTGAVQKEVLTEVLNKLRRELENRK